MLPTSPQTIGPFFPRGFIADADNDLTRATAKAKPTKRGETILLRGSVTQQGGKPCVNAILECWQADAAGRFAAVDADADPDFIGWGRAFTDATGAYEFRTLLPGGFTDETGTRAPHANLTVMGSGLMRHALTTVFFAEAATDPVLAAMPAALRPLLLAREDGRAGKLRVFRFDIRLRGAGETPFFDL